MLYISPQNKKSKKKTEKEKSLFKINVIVSFSMSTIQKQQRRIMFNILIWIYIKVSYFERVENRFHKPQ